jgi:hypothetical protein
MSLLGAGKDLGGRPPHVPTDQTRWQVEMMAGYGVPQMQIARAIGVSDETLRKYYRREFDLGVIKANAAVAETLFRQAISGDTGALIWWTKCRMGWRAPKQEMEHSGTVSVSVATALDAAVRRAADGVQGKASERHCSQRV